MRPASAGRHARLAGAGLARSRVRGRGVRGGAYVCRPGARRRAKPLGLFSISCYTAPVDDAFSHAGLHNQSLTRRTPSLTRASVIRQEQTSETLPAYMPQPTVTSPSTERGGTRIPP